MPALRKSLFLFFLALVLTALASCGGGSAGASAANNSPASAANNSPAPVATPPTDFRIVLLPDTQFYAKSYPQIFNSQADWIASNAASLNIRVVLGLGDIVDAGGELAQWEVADTAMRRLDGQVPYMMAIGNHDFDANDPAGRTAHARNFNRYFGPRRYAGQSWYRGYYPADSGENFYAIFDIDGKAYMVLVLEVFPRDSALAWAKTVVNAHADKDVILVTHSFLNSHSARIAPGTPSSAYYFGCDADNDGEEMWNKFVQNHGNIVMVVSGHVADGDGTGRRVDRGVNGNIVNQMLSDYQRESMGGGGYLRILTFKPASNQVEVTTYSPYLDAYKTDTDNQFVLQYKSE